jgi:Tfp pilus assembly protein PilO
VSPAPVKKTRTAIRLAVVIGGLVVIAVGGYFILVQPLKNKASSLTKEIATTSQEIADRNTQSRQAAGLSKILVADYFKLTTAMPDQTDVPEADIELNDIARDTGVKFDSITPGQVVDASSYQVIPLALTFEGDFVHLSDFLQRLQELVLVENGNLVATGRLFTIDQVSFAKGTADFPIITAKVQANTFVYGHPVAIASTTAGAAGQTTTTSTTTTTTTPSS